MEAFRFMHRSKRKLYTLYPLLSFLLLAAPSLVLTTAARAQTSTTNTVPEPQTLTPAPQAAPSATATAPQTNQSAAARVRARRQQRIDAIIKDIYGHKYEFFAGYGYLRFRPGDTLQHTSESAWDVGFTDYVKPKLGIVGDFRGYYGTTYTYNNEFQIFQPSISQYMYLFGAQYRVTGKQHYAVGLRAMAGWAHGNFDTNTGGLPGTLIGLYPNGNAFAGEVGIPVDINISPAISARITPEFVGTHFGSSYQFNKGFTGTIVYRFKKVTW